MYRYGTQFILASHVKALADDVKRIESQHSALHADYCETVKVVAAYSDGNPTLESRVRALAAEVEQLRANCNPQCPGCEMRPCNENGNAVLWCDECVGEVHAENERLRAELDAANTRFSEMNTPTGREIELAAEVKRLRKAIAPFTRVASGIPGNWPGECKLRIDSSWHAGSEYLAYHGEPESDLGILPTIAEWRALI